MKRVGVAGLAAVLTLALVGAGHAGGKRVKSKTGATIEGYAFEGVLGAVTWSGEVTSRKERCERRRTVNVFRIQDDGEEELYGTAVSDRQGSWEFTLDQGLVQVTEYRADVVRRVIKKKHGKRLICKAGSSSEEIPSDIGED